MKVDIRHILVLIGIVVIFSIGFYIVGNLTGSNSAKIRQKDKEIRQEQELRKVLEHQRDSMDAAFRKKFINIGKQHQSDSLQYVNDTKRIQAELKKLKYEKTNHNFRSTGLDSTIVVLSGFLPKNLH